MTRSYNSSAAGPLAGFVWQMRKALLALLQAVDDAVVEIEGFDDVAVLQLNGEVIVAIQAKHSLLDSSMTTESPELWKTIRAWAEKFGTSLPEARLTLATTARISDDRLMPFRQLASRAPNPSEVKSLVSAFDVVASLEGNQKLKKSYFSWKRLTSQQRRGMVERIRIIDRDPKLAEIDDEISRAMSHRMALPVGRIANARQRLIGWFESEVARRLDLHGCRIDSREFSDALERFRDLEIPSPVQFKYGCVEPLVGEVDAEKRRDPMYLQQLRLIDASDDEDWAALLSVLKARSERQEILASGLSGSTALREFDAELVSAWKRLGSQARRNRVRTTDEVADVEIGRRIHDDCMSYTAYLGVQRVPVPEHMRCGSYHLLSDDLNVGWHPDYHNRLKKRTKAA